MKRVVFFLIFISLSQSSFAVPCPTEKLGKVKAGNLGGDVSRVVKRMKITRIQEMSVCRAMYNNNISAGIKKAKKHGLRFEKIVLHLKCLTKSGTRNFIEYLIGSQYNDLFKKILEYIRLEEQRTGRPLGREFLSTIFHEDKTVIEHLNAIYSAPESWGNDKASIRAKSSAKFFVERLEDYYNDEFKEDINFAKRIKLSKRDGV